MQRGRWKVLQASDFDSFKLVETQAGSDFNLYTFLGKACKHYKCQMVSRKKRSKSFKLILTMQSCPEGKLRTPLRLLSRAWGVSQCHDGQWLVPDPWNQCVAQQISILTGNAPFIHLSWICFDLRNCICRTKFLAKQRLRFRPCLVIQFFFKLTKYYGTNLLI